MKWPVSVVWDGLHASLSIVHFIVMAAVSLFILKGNAAPHTIIVQVRLVQYLLVLLITINIGSFTPSLNQIVFEQCHKSALPDNFWKINSVET